METSQARTSPRVPAGLTQAPGPGNPRPRLLDQLRQALRSGHYSRRAEEGRFHWLKRFSFFPHIRYPAGIAKAEAQNEGTAQQGRDRVHETLVRWAAAEAVRWVGITKRASCYTLRNSLARHLLQGGYDVRGPPRNSGSKRRRARAPP